jgi:N-dimethylarginine dimethylaminohydrolase
MKNFGVRSASGSLKKVLMHRPGIELHRVTASTLEEFHFQRPVDVDLFISQYEGMLSLFRDHGVELLLLREVLQNDADSVRYIDHRPNMTYTRDLATVFQNGAVLMGPYLKGRWGDQQMIARAFRRLGIPILGAIEPPGFLEGGGVTMIGEDTVVASLCDRANQEGTKQLRNLVLGKEAKFFLEVPLPFGHIHIDGIFMVLDERLCLIHEPPFEAFPCRLFTAGESEPSHVMFGEFLQSHGVQCIPITQPERRAGHLNVVVTRRSESAIGFESAQRVASEMQKYGWKLATFPADEMIRGNGGPHCMTCPVLTD